MIHALLAVLLSGIVFSLTGLAKLCVAALVAGRFIR
jgi:hypothetical protein